MYRRGHVMIRSFTKKVAKESRRRTGRSADPRSCNDAVRYRTCFLFLREKRLRQRRHWFSPDLSTTWPPQMVCQLRCYARLCVPVAEPHNETHRSILNTLEMPSGSRHTVRQSRRREAHIEGIRRVYVFIGARSTLSSFRRQ